MKFRGVNDAFRGLVKLFDEARDVEVLRTQSRNGPVLQIMEPMIITYEKPLERVLLNQERDANCFFHLYESLFMLSGRNEIAPLAYYAGNMANYSDDGITQNAAYGYRWRRAKTFLPIPPGDPFVKGEFDQLGIIISHLKQKPESRRAVLHISTVEDDLLKMDTTKDQACNLCVMFSIRTGDMLETGDGMYKCLDMTVINRSNDLIFGALGANQVHFGFLQEYMAAHIGVEVGVYNQVTNNLHVYLENNSGFHPERWLKEYESPETSTERWYTDDSTKTVPLIGDPEGFDQCIGQFVQENWGDCQDLTANTHWGEPFLDKVAQPMCHAFHMHKNRDYEAAEWWMMRVEADDWRRVGLDWIRKRQRNWEAKQNVPSG